MKMVMTQQASTQTSRQARRVVQQQQVLVAASGVGVHVVVTGTPQPPWLMQTRCETRSQTQLLRVTRFSAAPPSCLMRTVHQVGMHGLRQTVAPPVQMMAP